jgi:hypothetical protein
MTAYLPPFAHVGLDFLVPMLVKIGRVHEKLWDAIFTCLNSKAIHIELAASLSTDSVIMAIRHFRGRSGDVKALYPYMDTNLRGAKALLDLNGDRLTRGEVK